MQFVAHIWTILDRVKEERFRQERLRESGKFPWTCAQVGPSHSEKFVVLSEEVGEVAREICDVELYKRKVQLKDLQNELIQVAAVACAHAEAIQDELESNPCLQKEFKIDEAQD